MRIRHAYTGYVYETLSETEVKVTDPQTGDEGIFSPEGVHLSGPITYADHHLVGHVGGRTATGATGGMGGAKPPADD